MSHSGPIQSDSFRREKRTGVAGRKPRGRRVAIGEGKHYPNLAPGRLGSSSEIGLGWGTLAGISECRGKYIRIRQGLILLEGRRSSGPKRRKAAGNPVKGPRRGRVVVRGLRGPVSRSFSGSIEPEVSERVLRSKRILIPRQGS